MRISFVIVLIGIITFSGCNGANTNVNKNQSNANSNRADFKPPGPIAPQAAADPNFKPCNPYFPLVPGSVAKYVINYSSGLVADVTIVMDAADEGGRKVFTERSQIVDRSGGMQIVQSGVRKYVCDGDRVLILSETSENNIAGQTSSSEFHYRENSVMMPDPATVARKGSTWTYGFRPTFHSPGQPEAKSDVPTIVSFEIGEPGQVTTPVGTFKTVTIARKVGANTVFDSVAPGIGLVKRQSKEGTSWELREYSGLKALE
jgi:hypothetical protein